MAGSRTWPQLRRACEDTSIGESHDNRQDCTSLGRGRRTFTGNGRVIGASVGIGTIVRESPGRRSRTIAFRRETWLQAISSLGPMTTQDVDRSLRLRKGRTMTAPHARIRIRMPGDGRVPGPLRLQLPAAPLHDDAAQRVDPGPAGKAGHRQLREDRGQSRGDPLLHRHQRGDGEYPGQRLGRPVCA